MFSHPKILFFVPLVFVELLNTIPTYLFEFLAFYHYVATYSFMNSTVVYKFPAHTGPPLIALPVIILPIIISFLCL